MSLDLLTNRRFNGWELLDSLLSPKLSADAPKKKFVKDNTDIGVKKYVDVTKH